jgi:shikimate dehydrogenase
MHQAGYASLGLSFYYVPFKVTDAARVADAITGMRALGIRGFGVSYPYKLEVMMHLDAIDPLAERIGAVNTIVNDAGRLTGFNTDCDGAVRALREALPSLEGVRVLLLGAGGASSAIAHGLAHAKARVTVANRSKARADALARASGAEVVGWDEVSDRLSSSDVLVNGTPLGMADVDPSSPVPEGALRKGLVVMDIVFKPTETRLLAAARARGATAIHGGRMLLHQAARQFELYTGREAPLEAMDAAQRQVLAAG